MGKIAISPGTVAVVESAADLLTSDDLGCVTACLCSGRARPGVCLAGGSGSHGGGSLLAEPKGLLSGAPHQDVLLNLVPRDKVSFVPGHRLAEDTIIFDAG